MKKILIFFLILSYSSRFIAQVDTLNLNEFNSIEFPFSSFSSSYTSVINVNNEDVLYSANMEYGLGVYDISQSGSISETSVLPISIFNNRDVSTIKQKNNSLFVGVGDFQVRDNASSGLAILDISNPNNPTVKDQWDSTFFTNGVSHLILEGDYAYLSVMHQGMLILDVSDENNIAYVSHVLPDTTILAGTPKDHQARGLFYRNDTIYLCFDGGGLRLIDVSDKENPVEVYGYINTMLTGQAKPAYNDIFIKDNYAFVSVDYCGLEILDISSIPFTLVEWKNSYGCNFTNWSGADIHTNEIKPAFNDELLFVSGGKTDVMVFDITDPLNTNEIGVFGDVNDTLAVHGLDVFNGKLALSYIHIAVFIPVFTPFIAEYGGLKIVDWDVVLGQNEINSKSEVYIYPNPSKNQLEIRGIPKNEITGITIIDSNGAIVLKSNSLKGLNLNNISNGVYFVTVFSKKTNVKVLKWVKL